MKKIILVRHAAYAGGGADPVLSERGKQQALRLGQKIKTVLNGDDVTIWSSSANRAKETADVIQQEMQLAEVVIEEKLWSDNQHQHDFNWLKAKLGSFEGDNLVIVSHLEYVRGFPAFLGYRYNNAGYAEGVIISDNECDMF